MVVYEYCGILSEATQNPNFLESDEPYSVALQPMPFEDVTHVVALCEMSAYDKHTLTVCKLAHRPH
ncbi:hypothetical protein A8D61_15885 [Burkholderia cenocepacia]|nr:hypothetical protein A8D61_15885 [Burkholderia cenocepacia]ONJ19598.1 hypothetical protein A8D82_11830 [Burkholderia cenocepacia]ONN83422.1 hypothetical protein A8D63_25935 [Burkholderia cenocepacia]ONN85903.1 hypothetical protein A8D64_19305 [Burkholderia cenocepacia]ONN95055.1 hypothetical protein A8D62_09760 [Burkholderia cenocepacia]